MNYLFIGKMVDTHGIKGEVRISLKDFFIYDINKNTFMSYLEVIDLLFKNNKYIYIGNDKKKFKITNYRHHKIYEMLTFEGITNINDILMFKGQKCFIDGNILEKTKVLLSSLIGFSVAWNGKDCGKIVDYQNNNGNILFEIKKDKKYFIPVNSNFINNIDLNNKLVNVRNIEGLII